MTKTFSEEVSESTQAFTFFLSAMYLMTRQSSSIVIAGNPKDASTMQMLDALKSRYLPNTTIQLKLPDDAHKQIDGKATTYVCHGQTCLPPTNSVESMLKQLKVK